MADGRQSVTWPFSQSGKKMSLMILKVKSVFQPVMSHVTLIGIFPYLAAPLGINTCLISIAGGNPDWESLV